MILLVRYLINIIFYMIVLFGKGDKYDLILPDEDMPYMNEFEL